MTAAEFIASRGEFTAVYAADPARVQRALDAATRQTDEDVFGDDTDEAIMWLTAHLLAADPLGSTARVVGKKAMPTTLYMQERRRLETMYCMGLGLTQGGGDTCP